MDRDVPIAIWRADTSRPEGTIHLWVAALILVAALAASAPLAEAQSQQRIRLPAPLASWRDTDAQKAIADFVNRVTDEKSPDFVPAAERIAVFDN
ncbi:MAG: hypothetical protein ACKOEG_09765, partial [Chthoniobacterales bacterium]